MNRQSTIVICPYGMSGNQGGPPGFIQNNYTGYPFRNLMIANHIADSVKPRLALKLWGKARSKLSSLSKNDWDFLDSYFSTLRINARKLCKQHQSSHYRAIYFHDVFTLVFCLDLIPKDQVVVLHPHMPELPWEEMISFGHKPDSPFVSWVKDRVGPLAFGRADYVILPNEGVLPIYESLLTSLNKVVYIPSGSLPFKDGPSLSLDSQFCHFCYIGRNHAIKGFDLLIEGFKRAYNSNNDIRLILVGDASGSDCPGVVSLGKSTNPALWMRSVDYCVNVNRKSYFDRSVIEALSLGVPLLIACTFGHSELRGASPGIYDIGDSSASNIEHALLAASKMKLGPAERDANKRLYLDRYTNSKHCSELDLFLDSL